MSLRITFDTNVLDLACRPERFPKDPRQADIRKVHEALKSKQIEGFYSVTMITIEGIMKKDRADVLSGTQIIMQSEKVSTTVNADLSEKVREKIGGADVETVGVEFRVEQPDRKPLHSEVVARIQAAKSLGLKALKDVPRIGAFQITDPTGEFYLSRGEEADLKAWIDKAQDVARAIEARGVGLAQVKALGQTMAASDPASAWFSCLDQAVDIHQERAVERAFGEWADADSIASHVAYGLDIFCSADVGNSNASQSVLDATNRAWLTQTYGVKFMTFEELAASLP